MPIFKEKKDKIRLQVPSTQDEIFMKVDNFNGTVNKLSFMDDDDYIITLNGGQKGKVGVCANLENDFVIFIGAGKDLDSSGFKVKHTIYKKNGTTTLTLAEYIFPDDYTGQNTWDNPDGLIQYKFYVDFL